MKSSLEGIRTKCLDLHKLRKQEVISVMDKWFEKRFIKENRPWHANHKAKHCRPVPIHRDFNNTFSAESILQKDTYLYDFCWPYLTHAELENILLDLGFIVYSNGTRISLAVPIHQKGTPYTYAQRWVEFINHHYSEYVDKEKKNAKSDFEKTLEDLRNYPADKTFVGRESIVYFDYKHPELNLVRSHPRRRFYIKFLEDVGITEYVLKGEYKGLYLDTLPLNL